MSIRGNVLVRERGLTTTFVYRWGAARLPLDLLRGPERFLDSVWSAPWAIESDLVWAEGAALVDLDRRTLRYFGGEPFGWQPWSRRLSLAFTRLSWRGWSVSHADQGLADFGLGRDREILERGIPERVQTRPTYVITLSSGETAGFVVKEPVPLMSSHSRLPSILTGPDAIAELGMGPYLAELPVENAGAVGGAVVDLTARAVRVWHHRSDENLLASLRRSLPGWEIELLVDGYPAQLAVASAGSHDCLFDARKALDELRALDEGFESYIVPRLAPALVHHGFAPGRLIMPVAERELLPVTYEEAAPWLIACARGEKYVRNATPRGGP